jgi:predicted AAA+ superfamily ATPase
MTKEKIMTPRPTDKQLKELENIYEELKDISEKFAITIENLTTIITLFENTIEERKLITSLLNQTLEDKTSDKISNQIIKK